MYINLYSIFAQSQIFAAVAALLAVLILLVICVGWTCGGIS